MNKLNLHTANKVDKNIQAIAELFPNTLTEVNREGKTEYAIDFDALKQELSSIIVESSEERYQFTWPDKKKSVLLANAPNYKTLRPCREESVNFDITENLYIEGDNLDVLKLLQETYLGKVKMIYIDPPYNTGRDFVYSDDFAQSIDEYMDLTEQYDEEGNRMFVNSETNGRYHTDWLNMIYPRLRLAKDLLKDDGVIFISIDDNEVENLKKICNEVFGAWNFVAQFPWRKRTAKSDVPFGVSQDFEWIICFSKSTNTLIGLPFERKYYSSNDYPNDRWRLSDLTTQKVESQRPNSAFDLVDPKSGKVYKYNPKRLWGITKDTFQDYYNKGKIVFPDDYDFLNISTPAYRVFESEDKEKSLIKFGKSTAIKALSTSLPIEVGMTETGNKECSTLLGNNIFSFPKPSSLIKYFLSATTSDNDIILDFFSGSATTAHAVMQLNAEDGGNRKFIMVQLPEVIDEKHEAYKAGYRTICDIGKERIRRAGQKIKDEKGIEAQNLDIGFRVLKVDSTNMKDVYYFPNDVDQQQLDLFTDNIKDDRTPEDLLFQVMLDLGMFLSNKIIAEVIDGKKVYVVEQGGMPYLIACFDKSITSQVITSIAKRKPYYAVFRDSGMENDSLMTSFEQIFEVYSKGTIRRVL